MYKNVLLAREELNSLPKRDIDICAKSRRRKATWDEIDCSEIVSSDDYSEFVVLDTETTGLSPIKDRIVEVAAIRFVNGFPTELFETLVNPMREMPDYIVAINHITNEMLADAPTISEVLPSFEAFIGDSPIVAHNLDFDMRFLMCSGSKLSNEPRHYYDTLRLSKKLLKKKVMNAGKEPDFQAERDVDNYKLGTLAEHFDITFPNQHRAAGDAIVTGKLFLKLIEISRNL